MLTICMCLQEGNRIYNISLICFGHRTLVLCMMLVSYKPMWRNAVLVKTPSPTPTFVVVVVFQMEKMKSRELRRTRYRSEKAGQSWFRSTRVLTPSRGFVQLVLEELKESVQLAFTAWEAVSGMVGLHARKVGNEIKKYFNEEDAFSFVREAL